MLGGIDAQQGVTMKSFFYRMICGILIGIGGVLPGVSGGIMAISMGLYEDIMRSIGRFFSNIKKNTKFLLPVALGIGVGILLTSNALKIVLEIYEGPLLALFSGLVLGSLPELFDEAKADGGFRRRHVIACIIGLLFVVLFAFGESGVVEVQPTGALNVPMAILAGAVLSIGVVIPGVSSSFLLIYIGMYGAVLSTIAGVMDLTVLFSEGFAAAIQHLGTLIVPLMCMMLGFAAMALLIVKGVNAMLKKHHAISYSAIIGFVIGSVVIIAPSIVKSFTWVCIPMFIAGLAASLLQCYFRGKRKHLEQELAEAAAMGELTEEPLHEPHASDAADKGAAQKQGA